MKRLRIKVEDRWYDAVTEPPPPGLNPRGGFLLRVEEDWGEVGEKWYPNFTLGRYIEPYKDMWPGREYSYRGYWETENHFTTPFRVTHYKPLYSPVPSDEEVDNDSEEETVEKDTKES